MRVPLEPGKIGDQELATPYLPIRAISGAIKRHTNYFVGEMVFRHATGNVGMVMLNADKYLPIVTEIWGTK